MFHFKCVQLIHVCNELYYYSRIWHISEQLLRPCIPEWMHNTGKWCWWGEVCSSWWTGRCAVWQDQHCWFLHISNHYQPDIPHIHHCGAEQICSSKTGVFKSVSSFLLIFSSFNNLSVTVTQHLAYRRSVCGLPWLLGSLSLELVTAFIYDMRLPWISNVMCNIKIW